MRKFLILLCTLALPLAAQEAVQSAPGAVMRALDKTSGNRVDFEIRAGQTRQLGNLLITMSDCRYPAGNPAGDAYAALEIVEEGREGTLFTGWMIASSPALSALEHRRYDVWVIRCTTS